MTGTNFNSTFSGFLLLNRLLPKCNDRNKNQNDLFHSENWPITPENWPISALFGVKNVVNFSNSSRQYSVKHPFPLQNKKTNNLFHHITFFTKSMNESKSQFSKHYHHFRLIYGHGTSGRGTYRYINVILYLL